MPMPTATTTQRSEWAIEQWKLDAFNAQRVEHDRQFLQLLNDVLAGQRARQGQFSAFLSNIRLAFDSAQDKRHARWREAEKDMREYAIKLHERVSAQSESYRDATAREGLASCLQRADEFRERFEATLQTISICMRNHLLHGRLGGDVDEVKLACVEFTQKLRSALDRENSLRIALSDTQDPLEDSLARIRLYHGTYVPPTGPDPVVVTLSDLDVLNSDCVDAGNSHPFDDAFNRLQAQRASIWTDCLAPHSLDTLVESWRNDFEALSSNLQSEFLHHPCMDRAVHQDVIAAPILFASFRAAECKRTSDIKRGWERHIEQVDSACARLQTDLPFSEISAGRYARGRTPSSTPSRSVSLCSEHSEASDRVPGAARNGSTPDLDFESLVRNRRARAHSGDGHWMPVYAPFPLDVMRVPQVSASLPVISPKPKQREAFRQTFRQEQFREKEQERAREFERSQSQRRAEAQSREEMLKAAFEIETAQQQTQADEAERRRGAEFSHALNRVVASHEARIADNCNRLALTLENAFADAQQVRESAFQRALGRMSRELMSACEEFKNRLSHLIGSDVEIRIDEERTEVGRGTD